MLGIRVSRMQSIADIVRSARLAQGLTLQAASDRAGCSPSLLSMLETGRRELRDPLLADALERTLGLVAGTLRTLMQWQETPPEIRARLECAEARSDHARRLAARLLAAPRALDAMLASGELHRIVEDSAGNTAAPRMVARRLPLINRVAAGHPREFTDLDQSPHASDEYVTVPEGDFLGPMTDAFATRVLGDSMEPEYHDGDVVVFSPDAPVVDGCDCFVRFERDQESTFKRVTFEGHDAARIRLTRLNRKYPSRVVDRDRVAALYAAVSVIRPVKPALRQRGR